MLKGGGFRELVSALHDLAAGGVPMSPGIARQVLQALQPLALATPPPPATGGTRSQRLREPAGWRLAPGVGTFCAELYPERMRSLRPGLRAARYPGWPHRKGRQPCKW